MVSKPKHGKRIEDKGLLDWVVSSRDGVCLYGIFGPTGRTPCCFGLDPHHFWKRSQGGPDNEKWVITLCRRHHDEAEANLIDPQVFAGILTRLYGYDYGSDIGTGGSDG